MILHHLGNTKAVAKVVKWILVIVLLHSEKKPLECGGMDVKVLHQAQLIIHALQQSQHLDRPFYCMIGLNDL